MVLCLSEPNFLKTPLLLYSYLFSKQVQATQQRSAHVALYLREPKFLNTLLSYHHYYTAVGTTTGCGFPDKNSRSSLGVHTRTRTDRRFTAHNSSRFTKLPRVGTKKISKTKLRTLSHPLSACPDNLKGDSLGPRYKRHGKPHQSHHTRNIKKNIHTKQNKAASQHDKLAYVFAPCLTFLQKAPPKFTWTVPKRCAIIYDNKLANTWVRYNIIVSQPTHPTAVSSYE